MSSIPAYAQPAFLEYVSQHAANGDEDAQRLIARVKPGKRIPKSRSPGSTKEERRAERNERAAEIRSAVMARAGERCEWCQREGFVLEWHHIIGGGARRHEESPETTCGVCFDCHRAWERNSMSALMPAANWAQRYGFTKAFAAIQKRIDRAEGVRP